MSPSHTMSAHWGKQIYTSWRQSRQGSATAATGPSSSSPSAQPPSPLPSPSGSGYFGEKRSMDSDRSARGSPAVSSGGWFGRRSS